VPQTAVLPSTKAVATLLWSLEPYAADATARFQRLTEGRFPFIPMFQLGDFLPADYRGDECD
jgi:hypothetical protein